MDSLRKKALSMLLTLTALTTVIAGIPYYSCACLDLGTMLSGSAPPLEATPCRCGGSCCVSAANDNEARSCCGSVRRIPKDDRGSSTSEPKTSTSQTGRPQIGRAGCIQILVLPQILACSSSKTPGSDAPISQQLFDSRTPVVESSLIGTSMHTLWLSHEVSPPTDITTVLQRLTI